MLGCPRGEPYQAGSRRITLGELGEAWLRARKFLTRNPNGDKVKLFTNERLGRIGKDALGCAARAAGALGGKRR